MEVSFGLNIMQDGVLSSVCNKVININSFLIHWCLSVTIPAFKKPSVVLANEHKRHFDCCCFLLKTDRYTG